MSIALAEAALESVRTGAAVRPADILVGKNTQV